MVRGNRQVALWLFTGCFLIFCMVIIGGITRLTGSGLSITEWKPIMGAIPPLNESEWQIAFEKYKAIPQFQKINYDFALSDFKSIFWWEYIHRLLGRLIGVVFIIPFIWFLSKKMMDRKTIKKVLFLFLLGAIQGVIGWLMVKSGLSERTSVSHIRLAIHLITAFITFGFTLYFGLELWKNKKNSSDNRPMRRFARVLFGIIIIQIVYGAFVAGMHAGKIYNTFPLMNDRFIPDGMNEMQPAWMNYFDNQTTVQFIHRMTAALIVLLVIILGLKSTQYQLRDSQKRAISYLIGAVFIQFLLGVFTILTKADVILSLMHQAGAFFLFSACVYLLFLFRPVVRS